MQVAIPLFPRFTALDAIGPYEVLQRIPSIDITFIGHRARRSSQRERLLGVTIDATFEEMPKPDIVVFPGGVGTRPLVHDERVLDWVRTRPRVDDVHHLGVHRLARARGRRVVEGPHGDDALGVLPRVGSDRRDADRSNASSSTSTAGSSPQQACRVGSTWHCGWSSCWSIAPRHKQRS